MELRHPRLWRFRARGELPLRPPPRLIEGRGLRLPDGWWLSGRERDLASLAGAGDDLDYMHARHCSPLTGRFHSVDPALESADPFTPQSWNRYN